MRGPQGPPDGQGGRLFRQARAAGGSSSFVPGEGSRCRRRERQSRTSCPRATPPDRGDFDRQRARGSPRPCRPQGHADGCVRPDRRAHRPDDSCAAQRARSWPLTQFPRLAAQLGPHSCRKRQSAPDLQCLDNWGALRLAMGCRRWEVVLRPSATLAPEAHARAQQSRGSSSLAVVTHDRATPQNRAGGGLLIITFSCRSVCLSRRRRVGAPYRKRG